MVEFLAYLELAVQRMHGQTVDTLAFRFDSDADRVPVLRVTAGDWSTAVAIRLKEEKPLWVGSAELLVRQRLAQTHVADGKVGYLMRAGLLLLLIPIFRGPDAMTDVSEERAD